MPFRSPWPPSNGPDNRAWQHLTWLAEKHAVTVATFQLDLADRPPAELRSICEAVHIVPLSRTGALLRAVAGVVSREPLQVAYYRSRRFARLVEDLARKNPFDLAYVGPVRMAPYGLQLRGLSRMLDYCDALSSQFEQRARSTRGLSRRVYQSEACRLRIYERRLSTEFEKTIITSSLDAAVIGGPRPPSVVPVAVGLDPEIPGAPSGSYPEGDRNVAFFGDMRTSYSDRAVLEFLDRVWPVVKRRVPGAVFWVVGRDPSPRVLGREAADVRVTGTVSSFREYFQRVQVAVAPLPFGSGVKTKVLQAMAAGVPVVGSRFANEGADAAIGREILIEDEPLAFAEAVVSLLVDPERRRSIGEAGCRFALETFGVESVKLRFEDAVREACEAGSRVTDTRKQ
jgi:polysaccharide biosynthesis protein PslH